MRSNRCRQQDLFEERSMMRAEPDADLRHKLRKLLQELLTEAADKAKGVAATDSISRRRPMTKITAEHLTCRAFVYVRQSTPDQVLNNHESRRRQYALADRARTLGWSEVEVIDDDLGRSGSGVARPGFEKL